MCARCASRETRGMGLVFYTEPEGALCLQQASPSLTHTTLNPTLLRFLRQVSIKSLVTSSDF